MSKLVTLKIHQGSLIDGYPVTLRIEHQVITPKGILLQPYSESNGKLPTASEVLRDYHQWQQSYRHLDVRYRLEAIEGQITQISRIDLVAECERTAQQFQQSFDQWLNSDSFRRIRESLFGHVSFSEATRFVLQIEDAILQRLPWERGDLFEKYHQAEVVLGAPVYGQVSQNNLSTQATVKILAILGNSTGINIDRDREILEQVQGASVQFLVEPTLDQVSDQLWQQHWDILFFAGHSSSQEGDESGRIYINRTDSFTLDKLKFSLRNAIAHGLKIAIFNSCDGLGLARSLADLHIPQVIVMREPVPDRVAHAFLKYFLEQFSQGHSFYRSVREAREKLQSLESEFPCATWLPVIYQNLTTIAPTWTELAGNRDRKKRHLEVTLLISAITTTAILATRFAGLLQPIELNTYDHLLRSRPQEARDDRIVVVEVTETDIEQQGTQVGSSLSDQSLNQLLGKLLKHRPSAIGIDIYLNHPISPNYPILQKSLKSGDLITTCKVADPTIDRDEIKPPRGSSLYGFSDSLSDENGITRRHLLAMDTQPGECNAEDSLSLAIASKYLKSKNVELMTDSSWQLGKATLPFLTAHTGGYQMFDDGGYQMLINYRSTGSLQGAFQSISLGELLDLPDDQLENLIRNRVILIGTTAPSFQDVAKTPYLFTQNDNRCFDHSQYQCVPGVFIQAQATSQLISAALENRPLLWAFPFWAESLLVLVSSVSGALLGLKVRKGWVLLVVAGSAIGLLWGASVFLLTAPGCWIPVAPMTIGFVLTGSVVMNPIPKGRGL